LTLKKNYANTHCIEESKVIKRGDYHHQSMEFTLLKSSIRQRHLGQEGDFSSSRQVAIKGDHGYGMGLDSGATRVGGSTFIDPAT